MYIMNFNMQYFVFTDTDHNQPLAPTRDRIVKNVWIY